LKLSGGITGRAGSKRQTGISDIRIALFWADRYTQLFRSLSTGCPQFYPPGGQTDKPTANNGDFYAATDVAEPFSAVQSDACAVRPAMLPYSCRSVPFYL
jgi:hypothetical protein